MPLLYRPSPDPYVPHDASWRQPLHLHYAPMWRALTRELATLQGRVLDVGCGMQPYRPLLGSAVTGYVGIDREHALTRPTVVGTVDALPFPDASFDALLTTQVLEHVPSPARALNECARVLRPGGRAVITVPSVWPTHEAPYDFWRFTRFGLADLLAGCGYERVEVHALGGAWAVVGQMIALELARHRRRRELVPLLNLAFGALDRRGAGEDLALTWLVTAVRAG